MSCSALQIRIANRPDEVALRSMQEQSLRALGRSHYDPDLIEAFIEHIGTMDTSLLDEGRYFVAIAADEIVASGGWSTLKPGYAARASEPVSPDVTSPLIRAIYVRPDAAGLGLGRRIMSTLEAQVAAAGYQTVALTAMLNAVDFYRRLGFTRLAPAAMNLPGDRTFQGLHMRKVLAAEVWPSEAA